MDKDQYINSSPEIAPVLLEIFGRNASPVIIDAGACEGEDSIRYGRLFPGAKIFSFEPHPANLDKIRSNLEKYPNPNITVIPKALADRAGVMQLHVSSGKPEHAPEDSDWDYGNKSHSLLEPDKVNVYYPWLKFSETIDVNVITLASFMQEYQVAKIDLLHADVQGAEKLLLEGLGNRITDVRVIWIEASNVKLYKDQVLRKELISFLTSRGFVLQKDTVTKIDGDLLFVYAPAAATKNSGGVKSIFSRISHKLGLSESGQPLSYAQSGEDRIIEFVFQAIGVSKPSYMDIGAFDPVTINNTYLLYQNGSRGWNIEPNPSAKKRFDSVRPKDVTVSVGIAGKSGRQEYFLMEKPTLSTFSAEEANRLKTEFGIAISQQNMVEVLTPADFVNRYCDGIFPDLLSLDVEGLDLEIVKAMKECSSLPKVICSETVLYSGDRFGAKNEILMQEIRNLGYSVYADTFINTIFLRNDLWK